MKSCLASADLACVDLGMIRDVSIPKMTEMGISKPECLFFRRKYSIFDDD